MYSIEELVEFLKVSRSTICRLMKRGEINYRKIGGQVRFMKSDIAKYLGCSMEDISF